MIPKFPSISQVSGWKHRVARNLCAATGETDFKEIQWILEVQKPGVTLESLADSGKKRFRQLDIRLAVALSNCIRDGSSELDRTLQQKEWRLMEQTQKCLKGRQVMWLILDFFKTNRDMSEVYNIQDLTGLPWLGDNRMHQFKVLWESMATRMSSELSDNMLSELLCHKMEDSKVLADDLAYYHRCKIGHEDHSYQFLIASMDRYLARQRLLKNRNDIKQALKFQKPNAAPSVKSTVVDQLQSQENLDSDKRNKRREKAKERRRKKREQSAARSDKGSDAAPGPKGGGKSKSQNSSRGGSPAGGGKGGKTACIWFNSEGGCRKGKDCTFEHRKVSKEELNKIIEARKSRSTSPGGKGKGKGNQQTRSSSAPKLGLFCHNFISEKGCDRGDGCKFPHLNEAAVNEIKKAHKNAMTEYNKKQSSKK